MADEWRVQLRVDRVRPGSDVRLVAESAGRFLAALLPATAILVGDLAAGPVELLVEP